MMCKQSALLRLLIALFTIMMFSLFTFTTLRQAEALTVSSLSVESGKSYQVVDNGLVNGALVYIDRGYTFSNVPALLQGATYIKTANDDKSTSNASFLSFDVDEDVTVCVAHDDAIGTRPSWPSSFSDTGENLVTTDTTLSIFKSTYLAGTVTLGGNEGGSNSMYSVVVGQGGTGGGSVFGVVPIGSIVAWHKSLSGTPALPDGWVECNEQTISDSGSVYNGQPIPNMNGEGRFLRGSSTSGTNQAATEHVAVGSVSRHLQIASNTSVNYTDTEIGNMDRAVMFNSDTANTDAIYRQYTARPINMSVVWIIRIK